MSETKPPTAPPRNIVATAVDNELARLRAENESLRGQLAAAGAARSYAPVQRFVLSEGDRAELETYGVANIGGRRMTAEQVRAKLADSHEQAGVEIVDPDPSVTRVDPGTAATRPAVRGVDFVYPSVRPGELDPAVAGLPGVSGPAAR